MAKSKEEAYDSIRTMLLRWFNNWHEEKPEFLFRETLPKCAKCIEVYKKLLRYKTEFTPLSEEELQAAIEICTLSLNELEGHFWNNETHTGSIEEELRKGNAPEISSSPLALAKFMHDTYEKLAPQFGYETRPDTKQFDPESPNGKLMQAVCEKVLKRIEEEDD